MLWFKALHIIFMVTWFAGLFYLPRLFVYHAECTDEIGDERFKTMEHRLYYYIMTPGAIMTTFFGVIMLALNFHWYMQAGWMHTKLALVVLLWFYHLYCGRIVSQFKTGNNTRSHVFYRWFNEVPTFILFAVVILVVVKPF